MKYHTIKYVGLSCFNMILIALLILQTQYHNITAEQMLLNKLKLSNRIFDLTGSYWKERRHWDRYNTVMISILKGTTATPFVWASFTCMGTQSTHVWITEKNLAQVTETIPCGKVGAASTLEVLRFTIMDYVTIDVRRFIRWQKLSWLKEGFCFWKSHFKKI